MREPLIYERIRHLIASADVVLFIKGTQAFPADSFSAAMVQILLQLGITFRAINLLDDNDLRSALKKFSDWPTNPQLYIKGEFIGGCDIVREMFADGELEQLLRMKNISAA